MDVLKRNEAKTKRLRTLSSMAVLQFGVFVILICLIWINETMDLSLLYFGVESGSPSIFRGCILTASALICFIVSAGATYLHATHVIKGWLVVCASCKKVKLNSVAWEEIDTYLHEKSLACISHGICPDCSEKIVKEIDGVGARVKDEESLS